jgi:hypothetical protein
MRVLFPPPAREELFDFIIESVALSGDSVSRQDINDTFAQTLYQPHVVGHLNVLKIVTEKLASDYSFPANSAFQFQNEPKSHANLSWLRDLHKHLTLPIAGYGDTLNVDVQMRQADCGNYRITPKIVGLDRVQPRPLTVRPLLHRWYSNLAQFHLSVRGKLLRPTREVLASVADQSHSFSLELQCIKPFTKGNGRLARVVENLLRLRWGLPWKTLSSKKKFDVIDQIMEYEDSAAWQATLKAYDAVPQPK